MNTRLAVLLASLLLASTGPALAAEPAPAQPAPATKPPPAAKPAPATPPAAATRLARILLPKTVWAQGIEQLGNMVQMQMRGHPGSQPLQYPPDFEAKVRGELEKVLPYEDLVAIHATELAAVYTPPELDGLVAFYAAPLGQKTLQMNSQVSDRVAQATQQRVQSKLPEVMKRLAEFAKPGTPPAEHPGTGATPPGHPTPPKTGPAPATKTDGSKT